MFKDLLLEFELSILAYQCYGHVLHPLCTKDEVLCCQPTNGHFSPKVRPGSFKTEKLTSASNVVLSAALVEKLPLDGFTTTINFLGSELFSKQEADMRTTFSWTSAPAQE